MITVHNLVKSYIDATEKRTILNNINLEISSSQSVSIQGASGSGKSTLLHLIGALDKADSGDIRVSLHSSTEADFSLSAFNETQANEYRKRHIGIIFQQFNLIDCISVLDNIMLPVLLNRNEDKPYLDKLLTVLGISKHQHKLPNALSGGEQQRVAIARALAHKPSILLADEPTGNLDNHNADAVSTLLVDTCRELKTTLIMVTHSEDVAAKCERQYFLRAGSLEDVG